MKALVAFVVSALILGAFAFSALHETPCASVAGQGQIGVYFSDPPPGWEFCNLQGFPTYSQVGETDGGLAGPQQPGT